MQKDLAKETGQGNGSLAQKLWGIHWQDHFPLYLSSKEDFVIPASYNAAANFLKANYQEIYEQEKTDHSFIAENYSVAKEIFYRNNGNFFLFIADEQPVGVFTGTVVDWSTYYFRNCSILPKYQGRKYYQQLLVHLIDILAKHKVERVEGDIAPSHIGHIHILNKLAFNITGFNLSERWGAMLHFTKFLSSEHQNVFLNQFCHGVKPQQYKHSKIDH